jgi:hypothetical protein
VPVIRTIVYRHKKNAGILRTIHALTSYICHRQYVPSTADGNCLNSLLFNGFFPGIKQAARKGGHSPSSSAEIRNGRNYTCTSSVCFLAWTRTNLPFNPLNAELNPICHLLALLGAHHILHVSRIRVKSCLRFQYGCCARIPSTVEINLWYEIALRCTIEERNNIRSLRAVNTTRHILFYCFHLIFSLNFHIYWYCVLIFALYSRHQRHFSIAEVLSLCPSYYIT